MSTYPHPIARIRLCIDAMPQDPDYPYFASVDKISGTGEEWNEHHPLDIHRGNIEIALDEIAMIFRVDPSMIEDTTA